MTKAVCSSAFIPLEFKKIHAISMSCVINFVSLFFFCFAAEGIKRKAGATV